MTGEPCCGRCRFATLDSECWGDPASVEAFKAGDVEMMPVIECHRHAPPVITVRDRHRQEDAATEWQWPMLLPGDWCGDFEPKPSEAA